MIHCAAMLFLDENLTTCGIKPLSKLVPWPTTWLSSLQATRLRLANEVLIYREAKRQECPWRARCIPTIHESYCWTIHFLPLMLTSANIYSNTQSLAH